MDDKTIQSVVEAVLAKLSEQGKSEEPERIKRAVESMAVDNTDFADIEDIASPEVKHRPLLDNPLDVDGLNRMLS